jgi:O-methyltransferase involved in polyketide biosynthesis
MTAAAAATSSIGSVDRNVHLTAMMSAATRALAVEKFFICGRGRGVIDRSIAGEDALAAASASVSNARLARMALRTWIVDRWLMSAGCCCAQVVLMGAGLDTRSYCLPLPQTTRVFELDLPVVISMRSHLLSLTASSCPLIRVP